MEEEHRPVLAEEVAKMLAAGPGSFHVDCTVGGGGHTERILEAASPDGRVLGLDADPAAIARVGERLARFGDRLVLRQANFRSLGEVAPGAGFGAVDGILLDLGLSSFQLADAERGFGFRAGGPLDMRFDPSRGEPAAVLLARLDEAALTDCFRRFGEELGIGAPRACPVIEGHALIGYAERVYPVFARGRQHHAVRRTEGCDQTSHCESALRSPALGFAGE